MQIKNTTSQGEGIVLFVDDQQTIVDMAEEMLTRLGFVVITARNGQEALEIYKAKCNDIKIILLDMILPGMSGSTILDAIRQFSPDVRVIFTCAYEMRNRSHGGLHEKSTGFLPKPFTLLELSNAIQKAD